MKLTFSANQRWGLDPSVHEEITKTVEKASGLLSFDDLVECFKEFCLDMGYCQEYVNKIKI